MFQQKSSGGWKMIEKNHALSRPLMNVSFCFEENFVLLYNPISPGSVETNLVWKVFHYHNFKKYNFNLKRRLDND